MNKLSPAILAVGLLCAPFADGQTPEVDDPFFTSESPDLYDLNWQSVNGRTYFMQLSPNLSLWEYFPAIELGDGLSTAWTIDTSASSGHFLFRLRYSDIATTEPDLSDFDGDGMGNLAELQKPGEDPLVANSDGADTDNDGMPDALERFYFGDLNQTGTGDYDGDGIPNALEIQAGQNPKDSDQAADAAVRTNYTYDVMGRLEASIHGTDTDSPDSFDPQFDAEGNLTTRE